MNSWTFRTPFSITGILIGILVLIFFSLFFGLLLFIGWGDINIECSRSAAGEAPICHITERHFLGLYVREETATSVTGVSYKVYQIPRSKKKLTSITNIPINNVPLYTTTSKVVLSTAHGEVPLSSENSSMNEDIEQRAIDEIQGFLNFPNTLSFSTTMDMKNNAGYIGLAGVAFLLLAICWEGFRWLMLPAKVMIDGSTMRIRPLGGKLKRHEIPMHQISSVSIATGQEAYRLIYPILTKIAGPSSDAPPSIMFTLSDGKQVIIPNFQHIPEDKLQQIAGEIYRYIER